MKYSIEDTTLTSVANAIRSKANITNSLTPTQMVAAINKLYIPKDILTKKNLNQWTKNIEFGGTIIYQDTGIEKINLLQDYTGISGYERLYLPVTVTKNTTYAFIVDYCSPTGWLFKDFDSAGMGGEFIYVFATEPTGTWSPNSIVSGSNRFGILGKSKMLNTNATNTYDRYTVIFNSGNYTTVYLSLSMGYVEDGKAVDLSFKNLALYQLA